MAETLPRPMPEAFVEEFRFKQAPDIITPGTPPPVAPGPRVQFVVNTGSVTRMILPTVLGNNMAYWTGDNDTLNPSCTQRLADVNIPLLRFPGGNASNKYHWNGVYPPYAVSQGWDNQSNPWAVDTGEFLTLCKALGAQPLFTANHGFHEYDTTATDGTVAQAAALAADWVEYCNSPDDGSNPNGGTDWAARRVADGYIEPFGVKYWEVGNEVYGPWTIGNEVADGSVYGDQFNVFHDAMKGVDPTIYVGINGYVGDPQKLAWTEEVFSSPGTGERVDFIDVHEYFHWLGNNLEHDITEPEMFDLVDQLKVSKDDLDYIVTNYTQRPLGDIKYYLGEFNVTNPVSYHSNQLATSLTITELLGELILNDFHAASFWLAFHSWSGVGDTGFMARNNPAVPNYTPYASYYPFYFYTRNFGDRALSATSSVPEIPIYASRFDSGELGLIIVNETGSDRSATIDMTGFTTMGPVNAWILSGADLAATAVTLNGVGNGLAYGGPLLENATAYYKDAGVSSTLHFDLLAHSATSIVIY
jgi:alpha-L-arabinofuranosidase